MTTPYHNKLEWALIAAVTVVVLVALVVLERLG